MFFSSAIDAETPLVLEIDMPDGCGPLSAIGLKLSRYGNPGPLRYEIRYDRNTPVSGELPESEFTRLYEQFVFLPINGGFSKLTVALNCNGKMPLDGYRLFGPCQNKDRFDDAEPLPYWWRPEHSWGMNVPSHYVPVSHEGSPYARLLDAENGTGWSPSFILIEDGEEFSYTGERFSFIKPIFAPPFSEWGDHVPVNKPDMSRAGESTPLRDTIENECIAFFKENLQLTFILDDSKMKSEDHEVTVSDAGITFKAGSQRGLLRALHFAEDMINSPEPFKPGVYTRKERYPLRITNGLVPAPANYFPLQYADVFDDGYLWRISRAGYNGIWLLVNIEEIVLDSSILPEMNEPNADVVLTRLERITKKASAYGLDVYIELRTGYFKLFDDRIYERLPNLRTYRKWGNTPCTGQPEFMDFCVETLDNLYKRVPLLKGILIIYDTEGFYTCFIHGMEKDCPNCKSKTTDELASGFLNGLYGKLKNVAEDPRLIAWTYFCDEDWNYRLLSKLDPGIDIMACISQFVEFEREGVVSRTDDYACCVTGPSEYFQKVRNARKNGRLLAKTEPSMGQEFVSTPFIPVIAQHQRRWDVIAENGISGFMGDYIHHGFKPTPCMDLMRLNLYDTTKDGKPFLSEAEEKLRFLAAVRYGTDVVDEFLQIWEIFSSALCDFFPYSAGVCRYPGPLQAAPAQPFFLDKNRPVPRKSARYNSVDLQWTQSYVWNTTDDRWNYSLVRSCFEKFSARLQEGLALFEGLNKDLPLEGINIARLHSLMANSMINFIDFCVLREKLETQPDDKIWKELLDVCLAEKATAGKALELARGSSILGFSCEGQGSVRGGYFTPETIEEKLQYLDETIAEIKTHL